MEICRSMSLFYVVAMVTVAILDFKTSYENTFCDKTVRNFFFLNEWCLFTQKDIICVATEPFFWNFASFPFYFMRKLVLVGKHLIIYAKWP